MESTWDLSVFYKSFDDPRIREDVEQVKTGCADGQKLAERGLDEKTTLELGMSSLELVWDKLNRLGMYAQLTLAADANDQPAFRLMGEISELEVDAQLLQSAFTRYVGQVKDLEGCIAASESLKANAFVLREAKRQAAHLLPESIEKWMLRMSLSGGDAFSKLRDQLMGKMTVEMDGKSYPLPAIRYMNDDPDPIVRKKAYEAEIAAYPKVALPMAFCLAGIKGEAITMCEAKGYPDVLTQQLEESRMDKETLDAMWTACREAFPDFRRYLRAKGKLLGHPDGIPFYDLCAPVGKDTKKYTLEEARALLKDAFGKAHPAMADFMMNAFDQRWIDVYPREGKEGGAFCADSHELKLCRILANFMGSFSGVSTFAHELGHAWHAHCMENIPLLMAQPPMPLAETASTFNETLLNATVLKTADPEQAFALLESNLMEATQCIVDIYSRFLFESAVFEARKTHTPTVDELNQMMLDAQEQTYGDGLAKDVRHPYMWVNKSHYYNVGLHFYNFPYAFGLLFGLGIYAKYAKEGAAFLPQYDALLSRCGSDTVYNVAASVGIDIHSVDYWRDALNTLRAQIDQFVALADKQ